MNTIIPIGLYPFDLMISFGESDKELTKVLKKYNIKPPDDSKLFCMDKSKNLIGRMVMFKGKKTIIRLNFMPSLNDPFQMGLLSHEIFHVVGFFMQEISTPLTEDTHEPYAYLFQYLTEKIYSLLNGK